VASDGKELREFNGETYVMEQALHADIAIIKGYKADKSGNVVYDQTAQNFNPIMATAAKMTICEVEENCRVNGALDPNHIHTPNIYVQRLCRRYKV
jgi:3-oxoacid CoA-transferase subunit A